MRAVGLHEYVSIEALTDPFPIYEPWPYPDNSVERISVRDCLVQLPHGDPRNGTEDALVFFMREAWRVLQKGGTLSILVPLASSPLAIANPRACRFFTRESVYAFAKPSQNIIGEKWHEGWAWTAFGEDFGLRFDLVELEETEGVLEGELVKNGP